MLERSLVALFVVLWAAISCYSYANAWADTGMLVDDILAAVCWGFLSSASILLIFWMLIAAVVFVIRGPDAFKGWGD